ncbi:EXC6B-like protein [Mya arenaria]|uniref:EXC6B-like protein n=1 Tax=Mya arenaria TaxID=6604 RepID=A0ABY7FMA6_MYAAR|nr:EXC6B-like protein [Mya arenaria]
MAEATPRKRSNHWKRLDSVQDADSLRQESINAKHEHLITEIETSDGPLATTLRAVYDDDELGKFMDLLVGKIKSHDKEIERMCNYHYQGFIDSVRELLQGEIDATNTALQVSCEPLLHRGDHLIRCRHMYGKLQDQMKEKRFYPALKTLEQLEHTYLPRVSSHWFSQTMAEAIPQLRNRIKEASMSDLKDFLENIRKHSAKIGEVAMGHAAEQNNMDPSIARKREKKKKRAPAPPNPFTGEREDDSDDENKSPALAEHHSVDEEELSAQDLIDFSPVYRCLHIYTVLHESIENYKKYFHDIVGFFVVEDHILSTTQGLVNRAYMDELWETSVSKIVSVLRTNSAPFPKRFPFSEFVPNIYNQVKEYINACLKFSADLHLSHTEIDDMIRKSTNLLLTRTLSGCLTSLIKRPNLSLLQDARSEAEEYIYKKLNNKIDEFLDIASYNWTMMDKVSHPSGYLMDLIAFLQSIFMSFTNLPISQHR